MAENQPWVALCIDEKCAVERFPIVGGDGGIADGQKWACGAICAEDLHATMTTFCVEGQEHIVFIAIIMYFWRPKMTVSPKILRVGEMRGKDPTNSANHR